MADETTTGRADGSNAQTPSSAAAQNFPEPQILEEVVIKKASSPAAPPVPPAVSIAATTPAAPAYKPTPTVPPVTITPKAQPAPTPVPPPKPAPPAPTPAPTAQIRTLQPIPAPTPIIPAPATLAPTAPTTPDVAAASAAAANSNAAADILGMPKLVRNEPSADKKVPAFAPLPPVFKQAPKIAPENPPTAQAAAPLPRPAQPPQPIPVPSAPPAPAKPSPIPTPAPQPKIPPPVPDRPAAVAPTIQPTIVPQPPKPPAPIPAPTPTPAPQTPAVSTPSPEKTQSQSKDIGTDIANILKGTKLPERSEVQPSSEKSAETRPSPLQQAIAAQSDNREALAVNAMVTPATQEKKSDSVTAVHTLKDDLQGVVKDQKISVVRAASLEQDRRAHRTQEAQTTPAQAHRSRRTFSIVFSILLLLLLGAAALFGVYTIAQQQNAAPVETQTASLIFAEQTVGLPISNQQPEDLKRTIQSARSSGSATLGSITRIVPLVTVAGQSGSAAQRPATLSEFLTALGAHAPDELTRALGNDYFFGIHTVDKNAPLLVIPVASYDHAFSGMLAWESAMNADLAPAFTAVPALTADKNGLPVQRTFDDLIMRNYDVRALRDDAGNIELYYSFPTQNILVIAESPYSFTEILNRLQAARKL